MEKLKIVAILVIKPEYKKEMEEALQAVANGSRGEEGNVSYDVHQNVSQPDKYIILEEWKSEEAIQIHREMAHYKAFKASVEGKVESLSTDIIRQVI